MTRRFSRQLAAAFDEAALAIKHKAPCESSGSEHFTPSVSNLVNSFFDCRPNAEKREKSHNMDFEESKGDHEGGCAGETVIIELEKLLKGATDDEERERIRSLTERDLASEIGERSSDGFKPRLMTHLRNAGLEAIRF
ncbi:unnamed protein product [Linum tenue]|uniref:Uncharacterized protein n=1 Tax=Linum tenue TaxID=586396 RepID=A0AAV0GVR0_9ROSI|nr:unnamed protein product [Linum tenue]